MKKVQVEYEVYKYEELDKEAKEKVRQWYLNRQHEMPMIFSEDCIMDLEVLFPKSDLNVQYSLSYCQGDGLNIYGELNSCDVLDLLKNGNAGNTFDEVERLTEKEERTIRFYAKETDEITIPMNRRYGYCMADHIDVFGEMMDDLEQQCFRDIKEDIIKKFEKIVKEMVKILCKQYEKNGYAFFYEVSEEDLQEWCGDNEYEFFKSGKLFQEAV